MTDTETMLREAWEARDRAAWHDLKDVVRETEPYGAEMIREDEFQDYARTLAEDIGAIDDEARWPAHCIDWKRAADELSMDYSSVTIAGVDYYYRPN